MAKKPNMESELKKLLALCATKEEADTLKERGFIIKNPTKLTLLAASLFEKALKGDLSAIREVLLRTGEEKGEMGGVTFIDDIRNKD